MIAPSRRILFFACVAAIAVAAVAFAWQAYQEKARVDSILSRSLPAPVRVQVAEGATLRQIARAVRESGAPMSEIEFMDMAEQMGVGQKLQAGAYRFAAGATAEFMIDAMSRGKVSPVKFTIIEGLTYRGLRERLRGDPRLRQELPDMDEEDIRQTLRATGESLEGLLLPETYFFDHGDSDLDVMLRARRGMEEALDQLWPARRDGGLFESPYEALILASVVEKETGAAHERPLIAGVFANRLRKGIPLQADPTVIYGLGESFDGNLKRSHLRDARNKFNTYARRGLPPTPIAMPGRDAIRAVLDPPETDYIYFVAKGDGTHVFSKTLSEHNRAVNQYQRRRKR